MYTLLDTITVDGGCSMPENETVSTIFTVSKDLNNYIRHCSGELCNLFSFINETIRAEMKWVSDIHMMMELQL